MKIDNKDFMDLEQAIYKTTKESIEIDDNNKLNDEINVEAVTEQIENKDVHKSYIEGLKQISKIGVAALASIIILVSFRSCGRDYEKKLKKEYYKKTTNESKNTFNDNNKMMLVNNNMTTTQNNNTSQVTASNETVPIHTIDYSNANTFYNHIIENRSKYGTFAESFQTIDDVNNFINFTCKFNEMFINADTSSTINSQETYDKIIQDYYKSCVSHDVKGQLNLLFNNDNIAMNKMSEAEELTYNLKNGKGKDYTIANNYYTWILVNFIDERTMIDKNQKNAPLIDALREQFEQYRYSGNMLNARKYQKNDSLPVATKHVYYADEAPSGVQITEIQNSFTCPDWGVDNVFSKYEENTEKKLVIKYNGDGTFQEIDDAFKNVLNNGIVR